MGQVSMWAAGVVGLIFLQCVSTFKLVCYFTSWSQYLVSSGRFVPDNIDPNLCTHIIYAFANISGNQIVPTEWNDASTYETLNNLKTRNPNLKTLLSVGGYAMGSEPFRKVTTSPVTRLAFVTSVVQLLQNNNFDGLDLSWHSAEQSDKRRLAYLVRDLHQLFARNQEKKRLLLSVAIPAGKEAIDKGYDIKYISQFADFLNFITFDFHGSWEAYTGHLSPLQRSNADGHSAASSYNVDFAVKYLKSKGAPAEKIIMGIPTYGRTFTLSSRQTMVGAPASGAGTPGPFTKLAGMLAYYEICSFNSGAKKERIMEQAVPYSHKGNQWVGYEDTESVQTKVQYMKNNHLGGIMIWTLDSDDFSGSFCQQGKYPLLSAIKKELDKA
ncbi:chitinase-3-like protein 1 [Rhineura floridana]|uniref:chitinase-3-like protein 1 n=1 Tax=Rhineura floridana TaxID=261503 RepID=UPI002AC802EC|nr:chitinase-3-like protein 1 [Rhineura floridana]